MVMKGEAGFVLLTLATAALSGCVAPPVAPSDGIGPAAATQIPILPIDVSGSSAYDFVVSFAMGFPLRMRNLVTHEDSRDYLERELKSFGLEVVREPYTPGGDTPIPGVNIIGYKRGTEFPGHVIVLSAHYDTADSTVYGAWDDGAGSAALLELARSLSKGSWRHTIAFAFFDGEERGLQGSAAYVEEHIKTEDMEFIADITLDPPGINYPCKDPDGQFLPITILRSNNTTGPNQLIQDHVRSTFKELGFPASAYEEYVVNIYVTRVEGTPVNRGGTSDHRSFDRADIANLFIGGSVGKILGPAKVMSYGLHTPIDTLQQMEARCIGGAPVLKEAFQNILDLTLKTVEKIDADGLGLTGTDETMA